jgi:hypothetical protein
MDCLKPEGPGRRGVKANVVFFTKGIVTENVWIYDAPFAPGVCCRVT